MRARKSAGAGPLAVPAAGRTHQRQRAEGDTAVEGRASPAPPLPGRGDLRLGPVVLLGCVFLLCGFRGCLWLLSNAQTAGEASDSAAAAAGMDAAAAQQLEHQSARHKFHPSEMAALARSIETTTQGGALWQ